MHNNIFLHFQKSGDRILTNPLHDFHISWNVICKIAGMCGVDSIHAGMWGGYSSQEEEELKNTIKILHNYKVMPALSCGMHPGLVKAVTERFGIDYMANVGGAIHGHSGGTLAGTKAMIAAIDNEFNKEYYTAIDTLGKIE